MEKIKLVEKEANPRDARVSLVKLSETGLGLYADALVTYEDFSEALMSKLSQSQARKLLELTNLLL